MRSAQASHLAASLASFLLNAAKGAGSGSGSCSPVRFPVRFPVRAVRRFLLRGVGFAFPCRLGRWFDGDSVGAVDVPGRSFGFQFGFDAHGFRLGFVLRFRCGRFRHGRRVFGLRHGPGIGLDVECGFFGGGGVGRGVRLNGFWGGIGLRVVDGEVGGGGCAPCEVPQIRFLHRGRLVCRRNRLVCGRCRRGRDRRRQRRREWFGRGCRHGFGRGLRFRVVEGSSDKGVDLVEPVAGDDDDQVGGVQHRDGWDAHDGGRRPCGQFEPVVDEGVQCVAADRAAGEQDESRPWVPAAADVAFLEAPCGPRAQQDRAVHADGSSPAEVRVDAAGDEHEAQCVEAEDEGDQADDESGGDAGPHPHACAVRFRSGVAVGVVHGVLPSRVSASALRGVRVPCAGTPRGSTVVGVSPRIWRSRIPRLRPRGRSRCFRWFCG